MGGLHGVSRPIRSRCVSVELVCGASPIHCWELDQTVLLARIDVGAHPESDWPVRGLGVEAHHFHLYWDGTDLLAGIEACCGGPVVVDGVGLAGWRRVGDATHIDFGGARFRLRMPEPPPAEGEDTLEEAPLFPSAEDASGGFPSDETLDALAAAIVPLWGTDVVPEIAVDPHRPPWMISVARRRLQATLALFRGRLLGCATSAPTVREAVQ
jgi:hypothetical protein